MSTPLRTTALWLAVVGASAVAGVGISYFFTRPIDPGRVIALARPEIAAQWQAHPAMMHAKLNRIELQHHSGTTFTGHIHYSLGSYEASAPLTVKIAPGVGMGWHIDAGEDGAPMHLTKFGGEQVFGEHPITPTETKAYGEWMTQAGHFGPKGEGVTHISRVKGVPVVRMVVKDGVGAEADPLFRAIADGLSENVFRGPVDVWLCDSEIKTVRVIASR